MNRGRSWVRPVGSAAPPAADRPSSAAAAQPIGFRARIRLRQVLSEAPFPAERWQLLAWAEHYGADSLSLQELHGLSPGRYETLDRVVRAVEQRSSVTRRPVVGPGDRVPRGPFGGPAVA